MRATRFAITIKTACISAFALNLFCAGAFCENASVKVVKIAARRFEYIPSEITLKKGTPIILQLKTEDRAHGFNIPSMKLRADIEPGKTTELRITPAKAGDFDFFCDVFCGFGHENMNGKIKVVD